MKEKSCFCCGSMSNCFCDEWGVCDAMRELVVTQKPLSDFSFTVLNLNGSYKFVSHKGDKHQPNALKSIMASKNATFF